MKNRKTTKKALLMSALSLLLCFSMLIGTTFAWFTDEVKSGTNQIIAGNLDVDVYYGNPDEKHSIEGVKTLFNDVALWEPGAVAYENLTVVNLGNLALKYQLSVNFANENTVTVDGKDYGLSQVLKVAVVPGGVEGTRGEILAQAGQGVLLTDLVEVGELLTKDATQTYGVVIWWEPSADDNNWNVNNGKTTSDGLPLHIDLGIQLVATQKTKETDSFDQYYDGAAVWYGGVDTTSWYNTTDDEFVIGNPEQLAGLAQLVNTGVDSFAGKTVKLVSDLNLNNLEWTPIGNWDNTFAGTFNGNGHTIHNLYINDPKGEGVGFFGVTQDATIQGITLNNVNINAYSMVAGLVGAAYPATISDCHITGDVKIVAEWAYVAGIAGYCHYGTQVDGCSTIANNTGLIQSVTRNAVGGITAWLLEGDHKVTNCKVENLNLVGWTNVGGITGFVHYNNTIANCSVKNVTLIKTRVDGNPGIGLIAGGWSYSAANAITLKNNTVDNATLEGTHIAYSAYNVLFGSEYGGATTTNFVLESNTTSNITNNLIVVTPVTNAAELKDAMTNGGNFYLKNALTLTETVTVPAGVTVTLDLNGKVLSMVETGTITANHALLVNQGNLTIDDRSVEQTGKISYKYDGGTASWQAATTISNQQGVLTIKGGTIESLSLSTNSNGVSTNVYKFTIDNLTNGNGRDAILNIEGGKITAAKGGPVRGFANSTTNNCIINISGGEIVGQVWLQNPSAKANLGTLNISGGYFIYNNNTVDAISVDDGMVANITGGTYADFSVLNYAPQNITIQLAENVALNNEKLTIPAGMNVTLDLNGYTLSAVNTEAKASCAIENKGNLTIKNGTITYKGVGDPTFGYGTNTINNTGKLVIDGATIINTTNSGSSVAIDCAAGANLIINSGLIKSEKNAIRLCPFGGEAISCTINGGVIEGARAIQIQLPSSNANSAPEIELTINGGEFKGNGGLSLYSYSAGQSFENVKVTINGGIFHNDVAFGGGNAKSTQETVSVTGGTFEGELGRYLANDGWEVITISA